MSETDNQTNWPKSTRLKGELIMGTKVVFKIDASKMALSMIKAKLREGRPIR